MHHIRRYTAAMLRNAAAAAAAVVAIPAAAGVLACYAAYRLTAGMIRTTAAAVDAPPPGVYFHDDVDMLAAELAAQSSRLQHVEQAVDGIVTAAAVDAQDETKDGPTFNGISMVLAAPPPSPPAT